MRTPHRIATLALLAVFLLPAAASALSLGGLFGSPVDAELVGQIPQNKRDAINRAEFELACAGQDVELAKLREELADRQDDLANLYAKLAKQRQRGAEIALDIAKMEAIIANGLGKVDDNRKVLAGLRTDRAKNDADCKETETAIGPATLMVRDWTRRVADKEKAVAEFKARRPAVSGVAAPAVQPAPAPAAPKPADEPLEIINKEPGAGAAAPAEPAAPAAEADLKN